MCAAKAQAAEGGEMARASSPLQYRGGATCAQARPSARRHRAQLVRRGHVVVLWPHDTQAHGQRQHRRRGHQDDDRLFAGDRHDAGG